MKIRNIRMALMEKYQERPDENKADFITKATASMDITKEMESQFPNDVTLATEMGDAIFEALKEENEREVDSVGVWLTLENDTVIDNSIELSTLEAMAAHDDEIVPIREFLKITLSNNEEETDQDS